MKMRLIIILAIIIVILSFAFYTQKVIAPLDFPQNEIYTVKKGVGLNILAIDLKQKKIVKSPFWFKVFSVLFGGTKGTLAGDYVLNEKTNAIFVAQKFSRGDFGLTPVKVTVPEGLNIMEISKLLSVKFPKINYTEFVKLASTTEGYLFPDTYFFLPNASAEDIISKMQDIFQVKIKTMNNEISNFKVPLVDIIKMASIVELEARTMETRRVVADILWRRLALGMALQVDSSFKYINGKNTKTLTLDDLKIDSLYNSYFYKGLPPTPICNPGLDSIRATVTPIKTSYLFFLSEDNGNMHYARTYAEHLQNKQIYLK